MAPLKKGIGGRKTKGADEAKKPVVAESRTPDWPPFQPILPSMDLSLQWILPEQVCVIRNFWTSTLCSNYVRFLSTLPLTTTPGKPRKGDAVRVNDRFQIEDAAFAERLWSQTALKELLTESAEDDAEDKRNPWGGDVLGLNPNIRVYRYTKGQFFDQHYDDSNNLSFAGVAPAKTTWTLLLYLTSPATGCLGGETAFYPEPKSRKEKANEPTVVSLETGMALLHRHGADCMLHEGREVLEGEKWVIRSDLCVRR